MESVPSALRCVEQCEDSDVTDNETEPTWVRRAKRRAWIPVAFGIVLLIVLALLVLVAVPSITDELG
jgi:anti-sigma factor RsiW